jgi:hypothetical protein
VLSVYDRDGICTFSEGRAFERLGITPSERVGRSLSVGGVARQRKPVGRGWFLAGGWAWQTELGSRRSVVG